MASIILLFLILSYRAIHCLKGGCSGRVLFSITELYISIIFGSTVVRGQVATPVSLFIYSGTLGSYSICWGNTAVFYLYTGCGVNLSVSCCNDSVIEVVVDFGRAIYYEVYKLGLAFLWAATDLLKLFMFAKLEV